jgi:pimeloyl-ACP methyl ester carboxylesterase
MPDLFRRSLCCAACAIALMASTFATVGCAQERLAVVQHASSNNRPEPFHLHLNGIGGYRSVDRGMLRGLQEGGLDADVEAYDWTGADAGLGALLQQKRHVEQSRKVEQMIERAAREQPGRRITLTAHSAGAGIIAWALEQLPDDVKVDSLVLLAPALSPTYDLTRALRHVTGHVYVFYSPYDAAVLGLGTRLFGTVDGVKTDAAGKVGFEEPAGADDKQYAKIVQIPYNVAWAKLGNIGDHIGTMSRPFARKILAPLLLDGTLPEPGESVPRAPALVAEKSDGLKAPSPARTPTSQPSAPSAPPAAAEDAPPTAAPVP